MECGNAAMQQPTSGPASREHLKATHDPTAKGHASRSLPKHSVELLKRGQKGSLRTCGLGTVVLKEGADAAALTQLLDGKDIMGRAVIVRRDKFVEDQASYTHPTAVETS
ncbi:RRM domain-containing protein [Haematococcus lacustris]|uniref:RRM domain-containing protein n=1 Tax=Haematococcus lacustris TaxID=44745 RepID=A0A699Z3I2_HAELA|nr:RRM domain-containing protein [Haematococcus lacustris]